MIMLKYVIGEFVLLSAIFISDAVFIFPNLEYVRICILRNLGTISVGRNLEEMFSEEKTGSYCQIGMVMKTYILQVLVIHQIHWTDFRRYLATGSVNGITVFIATFQS